MSETVDPKMAASVSEADVVEPASIVGNTITVDYIDENDLYVEGDGPSEQPAVDAAGDDPNEGYGDPAGTLTIKVWILENGQTPMKVEDKGIFEGNHPLINNVSMAISQQAQFQILQAYQQAVAEGQAWLGAVTEKDAEIKKLKEELQMVVNTGHVPGVPPIQQAPGYLREKINKTRH